MTNLVFWLLIATVAIAPLPFASNRPLPWSVLSAIVAVLLVLWGVDRIRAVLRGGATVMMPSSASTDGPPPPAPAAVVIDRIALVFAAVFGALIVWYWFQTSPASAGLAHPAWAEAARALGEPLNGAIALDPGVGAHQAMKLLAYGGVFFLAFMLCRDRQRARWAFIVLAAVGLAYAAYGLFAMFAGYKTILGIVPSAYSRSVTSTFINRNSYATYGGLCVIIAMAPLLSELRRVMRSGTSPIAMLRTVSEEATPVFYISALAIATGVMAVILTGSRAGVASLLLGFAVFGVGMLIVRILSLRAFLALIGAGGLFVAAALVISGGFLAERVSDGMEHDARWVLFEIGRQVAGERPMVGHGLGGFPAAFNGALHAPPGFDAYVDFAHNSYLELAVEGGIPALLISLALAGMAVGICVTALFSCSRGTSFAIAAIAGAALIAGHSMVDFSLQMPAVAVTFMLMLGVASAQSLASERVGREVSATETEPAPEQPRKKRRRRRRGSDRPAFADDSVTPPPEFDLPWMRPGAAATSVPREFVTPAPQVPLALERGSTGLSDVLPDALHRQPEPREGSLGPMFSPAARHWGDADGVAPKRETTVAQDEAVAADGGTESYKAALARWQSLRQAAATPARPVTTPTPPDQPTPPEVWTGLGTTPPADDLAHAATEELPPIVDATAPQPPMPPAWPGEARQPGAESAPPQDTPDDPPGNVVRLPLSRRP
ncbi:MAG: O-antigen ligase family protein [Alphaproteobacteria bacterium]|nr:O-antigen ligase family protein [Alphaproteobacteria bacterium]MCW5740892.1 O-antigen ligase family protein [Alphaproteobacteria bacterium]